MKWISWVSKSKRLAVVQTADTDTGYGRRICELGKKNNPNFVSDARLIAAAPELLEACKRALAYIDLSGVGDYPGDQAEIGALLAVIKKAEGLP